MRARNFVFVVSAVVWLMVPAKAAAQDRAGFWFGIGGVADHEET